MSIPFSARTPAAVQQRRERRTRRLLANRTVAEALASVAGLSGRPVRDPDGEIVGRIVDLVARWDGAAYPPVTGLVIGVGASRPGVCVIAAVLRSGERAPAPIGGRVRQ